ncbi:1,3-beta-glucan synthase component [Musa troglodytarum]|uniref:1,3-beta-glucan synthase component n=1 Tax=Musa troglodytarum TaxID=320322 RepID=A0A9E7I7J5_9LILI|nr:1,3-beta-glucan synthase component [Musa troglodytarum]
MAGTWLFTPFLFNPSGFVWRKIVEDWTDWNKWMNNQGGIGIQPDKCWESWWNAEHSHFQHSGLSSGMREASSSIQGFQVIAQVLRPKIECTGVWDTIQAVAYAYDYGMGCVLFAPIAALAWMPVISAIQTRVLFNQAFNRQLHIQPILAGKSKLR